MQKLKTNKQKTILIVEDNKDLNEINRRALQSEGYNVLTAITLIEADFYLKHYNPEVILLDILIPDGNGINFCETIRNNTNAHILFLTSCIEHEDKIHALKVGGDDYITKPYKLEEMLMRVNAAIRRRDMDTINSINHLVTYGPLVLNIIARQALVKEKDILLTQKEFSILLLLLQNKDTTISAQTIYETIWNQPYNRDSNAFYTLISKLKKKLNKYDDIVLINYRNNGYELEIL